MLLFIGGLIYVILRQARRSNDRAISFGRSRARMIAGDRPAVTFIDVAGVDEAKTELAQVVEFLRRKSRRISEREKEIIASHEVGHALVKRLLSLCDPVHKVTIISRGMALGWTMSLPDEDKYLVKEQFRQQIAGTMGGRMADEIVFEDVTSGAENDIQRATQLARRMVTQ